MKGKLYFFYAHLYGGILLIAAVPIVALLAAIGVSENIYMVVFYCMLGLGTWSGLVVMMFLLFGNPIGLANTMQKAEKVSCPFQCFDELTKLLVPLLREEYEYWHAFKVDNNTNIEFYARRESYNEVKCITMVYVPELTNTFLEQGNDAIQKLLEVFCGTSRISDRIIMTSLFFVDRVTPTFRDVVDKCELLDYKVRYLPVGISFGGKKVYIANPKKHPRWYKAARDEVLQLLIGTVDTTDAEST